MLFLIDLVFDVYSILPHHACGGGRLVHIALPCSRDLWGASTKAQWERAYLANSVEIITKEQLTYGDLLKLRFNPNTALNNWLSQLDDFGTLVMAAASLW